MTFSNWTRVVEIPEGNGKVLKGAEAIADVKYSLNVEVEELIVKTFRMEPKGKVKETNKITGKISAVNGDLGSISKSSDNSSTFTLLLADGREIDFSFIESEPIDGEYLIQCAEDFRQSSQ